MVTEAPERTVQEAPQDETQGQFDEPALAIQARLLSIGGRAASNGHTIGGQFEIDHGAAMEAWEMLGDEGGTFELVFGKVSIGQAYISALSGKHGGDGENKVTLNVAWSADQLTPAGKAWARLGRADRLEFWRQQGTLDLTTRA